MDRRTFLQMLAAGTALPLIGTGCASVAATADAGEHFDVIVVGAGIAGLNAALTLEMQQQRVLVLEASQRIGGRLQTVEAGGQRFDVGATDIGGNYWLTRGLAPRLGVALRDPDPDDASRARTRTETALGLRDTLIGASQWPTSALNPLTGRERPILPTQLLGTAVGGPANPLADVTRWLDPAHAAHDIPMRDWLSGHGWSREAIALMEVGATYSAFDQVSALEILRRAALLARGPRWAGSIQDGAQRLPEAMAAKLQRPVVRGAVVTELLQRGDEVVVVAADGRRWRGAHVVVAIPPGPLARIRLDPAPPQQQRQAWTERKLTAVTAIHMRPLRPFWETDGLPLNMWLDGSIERLFGVPGADGRIERIIAWINGAGAEQIDRMDENEIGRWAQRELARWRPAADKATEVLAVRSWGRDPYTLGAFSEIAPGRCASTAEWTAKPLGRLHFAGEHTGFIQPGIEAALASGVRTAAEITTARTQPAG